MGAVRKAGAVAVPALAVMGVWGVAAPAAPAGAQGGPVYFYGDLTGDGIADRWVLGESGAACAVTTEPGLAGGGYGPAVVHSFAVPGATFTYCPDRSAAVDLGGDGAVELVLGWYDGNSGSWDHALLILRDYVPVGSADDGMDNGSIGVADLDADGLDDLYRYSTNEMGWASMLDTASGALVPGPLQTTCPGVQELVDVDEDGRADLFLGGTGGPPGCSVDQIGAVLDDGTHVAVDGNGDRYGTISDVNGDGHLDIVATDMFTGVAVTYLGDGHGGFARRSRPASMASPAVLSEEWMAGAVARAAGGAFPQAELTVEYQCVAAGGQVTHHQVFSGGALTEWARGPAPGADLVLRQPLEPHLGMLVRAGAGDGDDLVRRTLVVDRSSGQARALPPPPLDEVVLDWASELPAIPTAGPSPCARCSPTRPTARSRSGIGSSRPGWPAPAWAPRPTTCPSCSSGAGSPTPWPSAPAASTCSRA